MSTNNDVAQPRHRTYGNWSRPRSPGVYGLGTVGTIVLIATPAVMVLAFLFSVYAGIVAGLLGALLLVPITVKVGDRSLGELMLVRVAFWRSRSHKEHLYLSGILADAHGSHQLPGLLARSELIATRDGFDQPAGIVVIPQTGHYTAVLKCDPEGASLVDQQQIDQWVSGYGAWVSQLAHEPGVVAASVTIETAPDPGTRLASAVAGQRSADAPALAQNVLDTIVQTYPTGSAQVTAWATVTYHTTGSTKRRNREAMINHVAGRIPTLAERLRSTGAGAVRPMPAQEIAETVRIAYDPAAATAIEELRAAGKPTGITWSNAGPVADVAGWDSYRHDSGFSRVWAMEEAPRGTVLAGVLGQLLEPHPLIPRKRITLIYRPHMPGDAARIVDRDVRTAAFNQNSKGNARDRVSIRAAEQAAVEEAEGAGVTRFSLVVAVTMASEDDIEDADTIVDGLQGTARLRLRPLYAGQRAGFAATLPTGVVLPEHVVIPTAVREAL